MTTPEQARRQRAFYGTLAQYLGPRSLRYERVCGLTIAEGCGCDRNGASAAYWRRVAAVICLSGAVIQIQ